MNAPDVAEYTDFGLTNIPIPKTHFHTYTYQEFFSHVQAYNESESEIARESLEKDLVKKLRDNVFYFVGLKGLMIGQVCLRKDELSGNVDYFDVYFKDVLLNEENSKKTGSSFPSVQPDVRIKINDERSIEALFKFQGHFDKSTKNLLLLYSKFKPDDYQLTYIKHDKSFTEYTVVNPATAGYRVIDDLKSIHRLVENSGVDFTRPLIVGESDSRFVQAQKNILIQDLLAVLKFEPEL